MAAGGFDPGSGPDNCDELPIPLSKKTILSLRWDYDTFDSRRLSILTILADMGRIVFIRLMMHGVHDTLLLDV